MNIYSKPTKGFWIIAIIAVLWNLMGIYQFYLGNFDLESLKSSVSTEEYNIMESLPLWYSVIFGIAVFAGIIGSILLLLRKKLAILFFMVSLIAVLIVELYWLIATGIMTVSGMSAITMPLIVIVFAILLLVYSKMAARKGWLK